MRTTTVTVTPTGVRYTDETPTDRDSHGVLWARCANTRGTGRPLYGAIHPQRHRHAMNNLLCQVCATPADRTPQGVLWLAPGNAPPQMWGATSGTAVVSAPPICHGCVPVARRLCPHLTTGGSTLMRARHAELWGVFGHRHRPGTPITDDGEGFAYTHPDLPFVIAVQQLTYLSGLTLIDSIAATET